MALGSILCFSNFFLLVKEKPGKVKEPIGLGLLNERD